ncbi:hypothetical protein M409DRAFT_60750 [Zasmidium cellare ATCC 36951]|uniref:Zn(2)-C6 fungal-type domain-containing protein n=1 Tax=Zasmidium cellare ATCC 36951 TaxID=1080233 RepID=A0A6A6BZV6_ZASCE|nr:uncharacterized protein M409DRAFT_60750 [Zasmidium cellare ATCC 36951]KAF2159538.1 hypothetical protein M409DRAFT_60750 [Zasmidium cellare ATCC 36951]
MYGSTSTTSSSSELAPRKRAIKAHRKSRRGCFTCKGRKVKCCESRPQCTNCLKTGLTCVYPDEEAKVISTKIGKIQYQSRGFSLRDMRFFHDFMTASFPHLPLNGEHAWKNDIPIFAQEHDFLMHAILALGASHLHARTNLDLKKAVERHRAVAMRGLTDIHCEDAGQSRTDNDHRMTKLNAQLATAYALTFCSSYMGDSLSLLLVLVRSCASFSMQIMNSGFSSPLFPGGGRTISSDDHAKVMRERLSDAPPLTNVSRVESTKASLDKVASVCTFTSTELAIWTHMSQILEKINNPFESYCHLIAIYDAFTRMSAADFARFADISNFSSSSNCHSGG